MVGYYDDFIGAVSRCLSPDILQAAVRLNEILNFQINRRKRFQNPRPSVWGLNFDVSRMGFSVGALKERGIAIRRELD